jgi:hypothetical protein
MQTLFVYDTNGHIIYTGQENAYEPVGVPSMWIDVPQGKRVSQIDISVTPHVPVYEDEQLQLLQNKVAELESKMVTNEEINLMVLEAMAEVYETVLPFLPV